MIVDLKVSFNIHDEEDLKGWHMHWPRETELISEVWWGESYPVIEEVYEHLRTNRWRALTATLKRNQ